MFSLHHVGLVVENMDEAVKTYCDILGLSHSDERIQTFTGKENQTVIIPVEDKELEVMEPDPGTWFASHLKEHGEGLFHLAIFTDNYDEEVKMLKEKGFNLEEEETTKPFPGYTLREAFLLPEDTRGLWIALIDARKAPKHIGGLAP